MKYNEDERRRFNEAREAARAGDLPVTLAGLKELVELHPDSARFNATYASALKEAGDMVASEHYFRRAVALAPRKELYSLGLFHCLWRQGKEVEALDEMKRFLTLGGESEDYREILRELNEVGGEEP